MIISIVVPIYNVEKYLLNCITSILNQTYNNFELILVNDGSRDGSGKICDTFSLKDERIKVIHKKNGGISDARNVGIKEAKGEWITFIDSDDYVSNDYLMYLYSLVTKYNADIAIGTFTYVKDKKKINKETGEIAVMDSSEAIRRTLLNEGFDMGPWAKLYRTEYLKEIKFPVGKVFEDSFTAYRVLDLAKKIVFGSKSIYYYIQREDSTVNSTFNIKKFDLIEMNEETKIFIKDNYESLLPEANRRLIWAYFSTLNQVLKCGNKKVIDKYAPDLVDYLMQQERFIKNSEVVPKRDKYGFMVLKLFGLKGYNFAWMLYLKINK